METTSLSLFEARRPHLLAMARRILGSHSDAEDVVQEAWLRFSRAEPDTLDNPAAWLTTVVSRLCLDQLRSRGRRGEEVLEPDDPRLPEADDAPDSGRLLADTVGEAMQVVLDRLPPAERVALVLHDMFDVPFDVIGRILDHTAPSARQLASRARRKVQSGPLASPDPGIQQKAVAAFLRASRDGDMPGLIALLSPDVALNFDAVAARLGGAQGLSGAEAVAQFFNGRARTALLADIDGMPGLVVAPAGAVVLALRLTIIEGRITGIEAIADPDSLGLLTISGIGHEMH